MKTKEELKAFREGAMQMQSKIAAWLVIKGHMDLAPSVLDMKIPLYQEPEAFDIDPLKA